MPYSDPIKQKEAQAKHYMANKGKYAESSRAARVRKAEKLKKLKSEPCTDCKISYPWYVMHYDHIGTDKVMQVSDLVKLKGWQTVLDEIAKCELVCANCHAIRTYTRLGVGQ